MANRFQFLGEQPGPQVSQLLPIPSSLPYREPPRTFQRNPPFSNRSLDPTVEPQNLNILDLEKHLVTWLALHRDLHYDNNRFDAGESLALARIDGNAARIKRPHNWAFAATQALQQNYEAYYHPLAMDASHALQQWLEYSLQHWTRTPYGNTKKGDADTAANTFWFAIKHQIHQPPPYEDAIEASFQEMLRRDAEAEEILIQTFPTRPRRTQSRAPAVSIDSRSVLRAEAPPFQPASSHFSEPKNSNKGYLQRRCPSEDSGYASPASQTDSNGLVYPGGDKNHQKESIRVEVHQHEEEYCFESENVTHSIQTSSLGVTRTRRKDPSIQDFRARAWILASDRTVFATSVLLDSGCWAGNWISKEVLDETHPGKEFHEDLDVEYKLLDGTTVTSLGKVRLQWEFQNSGGNTFDKVWTATFNVMQSRNFQMIVGAKWLSEHEILSTAVPLGVLVPQRKKINNEEQKKIQDLERQQQIAKQAAAKDREARRQHNREQRTNSQGNKGKQSQSG